MKPSLHPIGAKVRSINKAPGHPTGPLPGSLKGPAKPTSGPRVVTVTPATSYTHDPRFQVGPQEEVPELFGAYLPGVDPMTGKPWAAR